MPKAVRLFVDITRDGFDQIQAFADKHKMRRPVAIPLLLARGLAVTDADVLGALTAAESFVSGFEGDEMQEGVDEMLAKLRTAISTLEGS